MSTSLRRKLRITFLKWHRGAGLAAALFVIVLVGTGVVLNHAHSLALDHAAAPRWVLGLYGINLEAPQTGFYSEGQWLAEAQNQLYFNAAAVGECAHPLVGAVAVDQMIVVACRDRVYLFLASGELVEMSTDIPEPLHAIAGHQDTLLIAGSANTYQFDADDFVWQRAEQTLTPLEPRVLPEKLVNDIAAGMTVAEFTWERVLLDLHSGRLLGEWGVWFVDLVAIVLGLLAISGVWLRLSRPGGKR